MLLEKILQSQGFGSRKYCQQLIKNGSVVNLSNNRYDLIAWGDLKENVARNTIIPLKYKYTPYGDKIFKAGQVLSRVKIVIDYD